MIENLRSDRLEGAVREAAVRVGTTPNDWQSRCILAHDAILKGEREEARKQLAFLPSPFDFAETIGPGPILFAMTLKRELGLPAPELMDYLINRLLPALRSKDLKLIQVTERRQLLEGYVYAFDEPSAGGRELLGGKGVGLAEMTQLGVPVPAGFTITTDACRAYMREGGLPDGLEPGRYALRVRVSDRAQKTAEASGAFEVKAQ